MNNFTRQLRLAEYFFGLEDPHISLVKNKTNFIQPKSRIAAFEKYIENLENSPTIKTNAIVKYNISLTERNFINKIANDETIIIKKLIKAGQQLSWTRNTIKQL